MIIFDQLVRDVVNAKIDQIEAQFLFHFADQTATELLHSFGDRTLEIDAPRDPIAGEKAEAQNFDDITQRQSGAFFGDTVSARRADRTADIACFDKLGKNTANLNRIHITVLGDF